MMKNDPGTAAAGRRYRRSRRTLALALLVNMICVVATSSATAAVVYEGGAGVAFDSFSLVSNVNVPNVDDRILLVAFGSISENFIDIVPTSLTYRGQALQHAGGRVQNVFTDFYARTDFYYMLNPNVGPGTLQGQVNAWNPGGFRQESVWGMYGMVFSGVQQLAPEILFTSSQNPNAPSQTIGGTVTTTVDDAMLVGATALNAGINSLFTTTGITEVYDIAVNEMSFGVAHKGVGAAGNHPFTWTSAGYASGIGTTVIAQLQPVTVVPVPPMVWLVGLASCILMRRRRLDAV